jgi:preprotein translocase subunit SecD
LRLERIASRKSSVRGLALGCALSLAAIGSIGRAAAEPLPLQIVHATAGLDQRTSKPIVTIALTEASKRSFAQFTSGRVGGKMELRVNGQVLSTAVLKEPLLGDSFQISGDFSVDETNAMAGRLSTPGVKVELEFLSD